jgi:hypothetical protein
LFLFLSKRRKNIRYESGFGPGNFISPPTMMIASLSAFYSSQQSRDSSLSLLSLCSPLIARCKSLFQVLASLKSPCRTAATSLICSSTKLQTWLSISSDLFTRPPMAVFSLFFLFFLHLVCAT